MLDGGAMVRGKFWLESLCVGFTCAPSASTGVLWAFRCPLTVKRHADLVNSNLRALEVHLMRCLCLNNPQNWSELWSQKGQTQVWVIKDSPHSEKEERPPRLCLLSQLLYVWVCAKRKCVWAEGGGYTRTTSVVWGPPEKFKDDPSDRTPCQVEKSSPALKDANSLWALQLQQQTHTHTHDSLWPHSFVMWQMFILGVYIGRLVGAAAELWWISFNWACVHTNTH